MICTNCRKELPDTKFNPESFSPDVCFKCRISNVRLGFSATRAGFHGDNLVGGTIQSDNRHTVELARSNGHDPVPVSRGVSHGLTSGQMDRLKKAVSAGGGDNK